MKEVQIHSAIGELSEDLIAPVAKLRQKKRYPVLKWAAVAACLCLLLGLPLSWDDWRSVKSESLNGEAIQEEPKENFFYGSVADGVNAAVFRAKVLEVYDSNCVLVEPLEGEDELRCSDKIEVSFWKLEKIPEIAVGDIVEVVYDGLIQETYPARITGTASIKVIE